MFPTVILALAFLSANAVPAAAQPSPPVYIIHINEYPPYFQNQFEGDVPVGAIVRWINKGSQPHTVTADGCSQSYNTCYFDSGPIYPQQTFENERPVQEIAAGNSYRYHCAIHPIMRGTLKINAAPSK